MTAERHNQYVQYFMDVAVRTAELSHATRRQVGAVLVYDYRQIAVGFNGTPAGFDNCCEADGKTKPEVIHAEQNLLAYCAKYGIGTIGADLYVTTAPCVYCAKLIIAAGIKKVYYLDTYKDEDGLKLLMQGGIEVIWLS